MDIQKIKYNQALMKTKIRLKKELEMVNTELDTIQDECNHVGICLGGCGKYIVHCLFCGIEPDNTKIDATYYKQEEYGCGSISEYRKARYIELQNLWIELATKYPELNQDELVNKINEIIEENIEQEKEKKLLK